MRKIPVCFVSGGKRKNEKKCLSLAWCSTRCYCFWWKIIQPAKSISCFMMTPITEKETHMFISCSPLLVKWKKKHTDTHSPFHIDIRLVPTVMTGWTERLRGGGFDFVFHLVRQRHSTCHCMNHPRRWHKEDHTTNHWTWDEWKQCLLTHSLSLSHSLSQKLPTYFSPLFICVRTTVPTLQHQVTSLSLCDSVLGQTFSLSLFLCTERE